MSWGKERIAQLQLPNPEDDDPHPRLLLEGDGVHAGQGLQPCFQMGGMILPWRCPGSRPAPAAGTYRRLDLRVCALSACS